MKRVLDYDPWTGTTTFHEYDHDTKTTTLWTEQDASPFLESNRRLANDEDRKKRGIKDCWWHVATIPNGVIDAWMKEGINVFDKNQAKEVARRLNHPDWRYLRTSPGRM